MPLTEEMLRMFEDAVSGNGPPVTVHGLDQYGQPKQEVFGAVKKPSPSAKQHDR